MFNRARDARRVAKSVRTHEKTMQAYGNAAASNLGNNFTSTITIPNEANTGLTTSKETYPSAVAWAAPKSVRHPNSLRAKIDRQHKKGLITQGEAATEKLEIHLSGKDK